MTVDTHGKGDAVVVNGRGQIGSLGFRVLEKLALPQFLCLRNEVIIAPIVFGVDQVKAPGP